MGKFDSENAIRLSDGSMSYGFSHTLGDGFHNVVVVLPSGDSLTTTYRPTESGGVRVYARERRLLTH